MITLFNEIELEKIKSLAIKAGNLIMRVYEKDFAVEYKEDKSPLTEADKISNEFICSGLQKLYPSIPIISEENKQTEYKIRKDWEYYWCIDPIDGTKEFIKKNGEFTVNIALIHRNTPVLGVVYAPALGDIYYAKSGMGAYKNDDKLPMYKNKAPKKSLKVVASKSHLSEETQGFIDNLESETIEQVSIGSSLKLCMVATGEADIYPRLAPTMEWDTAAAHALVLEAGKEVIEYEKETDVIYNKENLLNPWFIVR